MEASTLESINISFSSDQIICSTMIEESGEVHTPSPERRMPRPDNIPIRNSALKLAYKDYPMGDLFEPTPSPRVTSSILRNAFPNFSGAYDFSQNNNHNNTPNKTQDITPENTQTGSYDLPTLSAELARPTRQRVKRSPMFEGLRNGNSGIVSAPQPRPTLTQEIAALESDGDTSLFGGSRRSDTTSGLKARNTRFTRGRQTSAPMVSIQSQQANGMTAQSFGFPEGNDLSGLVVPRPREREALISPIPTERPQRRVHSVPKRELTIDERIRNLKLSPKEEHAILASLASLQGQVHRLEMEKSETALKTEEYQHEIQELRVAVEMEQSLRRPDSALGSDEEDHARNEWREAEARLNSTIKNLQNELQICHHKISVSDAATKRLIAEREEQANNLGNANELIDEIKLEKNQLIEAHGQLRRENSDLQRSSRVAKSDNDKLRLELEQLEAVLLDKTQTVAQLQAQAEANTENITLVSMLSAEDYQRLRLKLEAERRRSKIRTASASPPLLAINKAPATETKQPSPPPMAAPVETVKVAKHARIITPTSADEISCASYESSVCSARSRSSRSSSSVSSTDSVKSSDSVSSSASVRSSGSVSSIASMSSANSMNALRNQPSLQSMSPRRSRRMKNLPAENTSAFILPDITMQASDAKPDPITSKIEEIRASISSDTSMADKPKTVTTSPKVGTAPHPRPSLDLSDLSLSGFDVDATDVTIRPSQPPAQALDIVMKQLNTECTQLKEKLARYTNAYSKQGPEYSGRKRRYIKDKIDTIMQQVEYKSDQIYNLQDVVEGHKQAAAAAAAAQGTQPEDIYAYDEPSFISEADVEQSLQSIGISPEELASRLQQESQEMVSME